MADYKFDGKEFRDRRGSKIGVLDGNIIRDARGSKISTIDDVNKIVDGIGGASLVAMWLFFVR